ncbi:MAG: TIGR03084 family metal-binding protein [Actinomycetota bacterium]
MIEITEDLTAEQAALDAIVAHIDGPSWCEATPAEGWNISDQIGHLTFFDERATMAITDREAFASELGDAVADIDAYMDGHLAVARTSSPHDLLVQWRAARYQLAEALATLDPSDRVPWYGPDMSARTFATARLMEVWAHGQDVADALGVVREPTARLRHIAFLGVKTMGWSFAINGLEVPVESVYVDLTAPDGGTWTWGDAASRDSVSGSAEEFCLVVTQRRNVKDTDLDVLGDVATQWMQIAQAYAGPPGPGRPENADL